MTDKPTAAAAKQATASATAGEESRAAAEAELEKLLN